MSDEFKEKEVVPELVECGNDELTVSLQSSTSEKKDSRLGTTIGGHYEILSKIGSGGMSTVYKAKHTLLDRIVAIKFILPKLIHDEQTTKRFQQEAKAASELKHDNVCAVNEFGIHDENQAFLVMEYFEGRSLADLIREEGTIEYDRALLIIKQLCSGLDHAHSKGVIHRDIKPSNIILTKDSDGYDSIKIVDFGIAKLIRDDQSGPNLTQTGEVFGTPSYMSPEQCHGLKVDNRSDIYAVGCVLYEMVEGHPPFQGDSNMAVLMAHCNDSPEPISKTLPSEAIWEVIQLCLKKDPEDRYNDLEQLSGDIEKLSDNQSPLVAVKRAGLTALLLRRFYGMDNR